MTATIIRNVDPADLERDVFASLRCVITQDECIARGIARGETLIAIGVIDRNGRSTMPNDPTLRLAIDSRQPPTDDEIAELLRDLIRAAESLGANRLTVGWDPMDFAGLKRLEAAGFRPTGTLPYFEFAGGHVEYITGYQDATGATMDMMLELMG
jgi:hypothetical protein